MCMMGLCFKGVLRKFSGCFKEVSMGFHGVKTMFKGGFKRILRKLQGFFMEISRVCT